MTTKRASKKAPASPAAELLEFAQERAKTASRWEDLSNAIYGIGGRFAELFPDQKERTAFAKTSEFKAIADLISKLPHGERADQGEIASGNFVLRLPASMHAALVAEAKMEGVSLNQLCLAKLAIQLRAAVR